MAHISLTIRTAYGPGAPEHHETVAKLERALDADPNVLEFQFGNLHFAPDQQVQTNTEIDDLPAWVDTRIALIYEEVGP